MAQKVIKQEEENKIQCTICGVKKTESSTTQNYYNASPSSVFKNAYLKKIPFCKKCLKERYIDYYTKSTNPRWSIYKMCETLDIAFFEVVFDACVKRVTDGDWQALLGSYMTMYNSIGSKNGWEYSFDSSDKLNVDYAPTGDVEIVKKKTKLQTEDKEAKEEIIDKLGYDPFEEYSIEDRKLLYPIFRGYLDEDNIEDNYLVSVFSKICFNNAQIQKCNSEISKLSSDGESMSKNADNIKQLYTLVKDIEFTNDKLAKENGISLIAKKKTSSSVNKTALSGIMKTLNDYDFDEIEVDYYDQMKAYGMRQTAEISFKAITEQIKFGENDIDEIITEQRELIHTLQDQVLDLKEKNRVYYKELRANNIKVDGLFKEPEIIVEVQDYYDPNAIPEKYRDSYGGEENDILYEEDNISKELSKEMEGEEE